MGLFSMLASMFSGGILLGETCKDANYASNNREEARRNGRLTYGDGKGNEYLVSTGERVYTNGGKIYSVKHPTIVLHDGWKQHYMELNEKELASAKEKGKKYAFLYYPDCNGRNGYSGHYIELSTMKRFKVNLNVYLNSEIHDWDWSYVKTYYTNNGEYDDSVIIDRKEFEELGGRVPYGMTPEEYQKQKWKEEEKNYKKLMKGL